ncbi:RHS repeat protein [Pseudomonas putida]
MTDFSCAIAWVQSCSAWTRSSFYTASCLHDRHIRLFDRYEIDFAGQLTRYVDPEQKNLRFHYDTSDRLVETGQNSRDIKFRHKKRGPEGLFFLIPATH